MTPTAMNGAALVLQGDARRLPLPDASVDLVCTSPPYLWKRKYAIDGDGEMGNEANWRLYLDGLFAATDEMLRVLKPTGSIFVNLGDTRVAGREPKWLGIPPKSRLLLPERYRVGCQDRYASRGVIVRQVQLWEKANGLPESVTDRTRDTHEDWVHIVKRSSYYAALDEIRAPYTARAIEQADIDARASLTAGTAGRKDTGNGVERMRSATILNPLGALPGSVWRIASEPLHLPKWLGIDHYAAFASEWPRRLALAFSPPGICLDCGQGRVPVVEKRAVALRGNSVIGGRKGTDESNHWGGLPVLGNEATILGYACSCTPFTDHPGTGESNGAHGVPGQDPRALDDGHAYFGRDGRRSATSHGGVGDRSKVGPWREYHLDGWKPPPTRPAVVLDVFGGTGTVAMVARALDRIGVSIDLSHSYSRAARWRVHHDAGKAISRTWVERQGSLL
jgi:hypothetical protein